MLIVQATQPKCEKISLKDWCRNMPFKEASMQHTTSCGQNILDTQVNGPYTASNEKKVLIKKLAKAPEPYTEHEQCQVILNERAPKDYG